MVGGAEWQSLRRELDRAALRLDEVGAFEGFANSLPFPAWLKGPGLRMRWFNAAYREAYPEEAAGYLGRSDFYVWPIPVARCFREKDIQVQETDGPVVDVEFDNGQAFLSIKWPVRIDDDTLGVAGLALPVAMLASAIQGVA